VYHYRGYLRESNVMLLLTVSDEFPCSIKQKSGDHFAVNAVIGRNHASMLINRSILKHAVFRRLELAAARSCLLDWRQ
jgi:hypothetical protein